MGNIDKYFVTDDDEDVFEYLNVLHEPNQEQDIRFTVGENWTNIPYDPNQNLQEFTLQACTIGVKWVTTRLRALNAALNTFMLLFAAEMILAFVNAKNFYGNENINNCLLDIDDTEQWILSD